jgi:hypothetical protein
MGDGDAVWINGRTERENETATQTTGMRKETLNQTGARSVVRTLKARPTGRPSVISLFAVLSALTAKETLNELGEHCLPRHRVSLL